MSGNPRNRSPETRHSGKALDVAVSTLREAIREMQGKPAFKVVSSRSCSS